MVPPPTMPTTAAAAACRGPLGDLNSAPVAAPAATEFAASGTSGRSKRLTKQLSIEAKYKPMIPQLFPNGLAREPACGRWHERQKIIRSLTRGINGGPQWR